MGDITHFSSYYKSLSYVSPIPLANLKLWLKADAGITKDGSNYVSQWDDMSGNGNHAVQSTGGSQPLWVDNQLNGKPVLRFDGIDDFMNSAISNVSNITIFCVVKSALTSAWVGGFSLYNTGSPLDYDINMGISIIGHASQNGKYWFTKDGANYTYNNGSITNYETIEIQSINNNTIATYYNGIGLQSYNIPAFFNINSYVIGARWVLSVINYYMSCDFSEIILYDDTLSAAQRQQVEQYLRTKYNHY